MVSATAAVVRGIDQPFSFEQVELADPQPSELLVRITSVGLCHTDLAVVHGQVPSPFPIVLGHEGAGIVEAVGSDVTGFAVGDRVAASFASCGHCANCLRGREAYCEKFMVLNFGGVREDGSTTLTDADGKVLHGSFFGQSSFATYALVAARNVVKVPDSIDLDLTGPLGCGIQTGAGAVINSLRVTAGASIVISGTGAVGLSAIMAANAVGATTIIAVDVLESRLQAALELGATHTVNGKSDNVVEQILAITGAAGADFAVDTTGVAPVVLNDIAAVGMGGSIGLLGVSKPDATIPLMAMSGKTVVNLLEGDAVPQIFIPQMIALRARGLFPFDKLITKYPFTQIEQAVEDTRTGAAVKAVLVMS